MFLTGFGLRIMLYLVVQFDLDILSYQRSEDAVRRYIMVPRLSTSSWTSISFFKILRVGRVSYDVSFFFFEI